ncbi:CDP-diacylglycerol--serine O-phosphatidyltransferase [Arsenophonus endosymbiont of Aleurodicus dispersus]|uniref:CDP-diacylglycerol--serine O-phosphatidyltransferase n=1 Tax=Arsenophonus endosymbiont of Aleurodicus dispersus TaxID=235559 RepID=UPI000EB55343|nr:CDP-diacylglycerol--serine O-phosphatidyltransferase [Arsenophonus endosymbiont of Aleurodicus dispersus]VAY02237.1 CDP-diacylglycerol--serine O-phosphatidyltransferase [Arsenophonus endosymbiont of Aleurodicus dispersus]
MLSKLKKAKNQQYLEQLAKLPQSPDGVVILYQTASFRKALLEKIANAQRYIYITALYFEHDDAGRDILNALYKAKIARPYLDIKIMVDWHRAQRGRLGEVASSTNADWYCQMAMTHPGLSIAIFGIPINTREALGVLHLKSLIFDDTVIYSGASINDVYLQQHQRYRYDRYHILDNAQLAITMKRFIDQRLLSSPAIQRLDKESRPHNTQIKSLIKQFRHSLKSCHYELTNKATNQELAVTPLIGLGKKNELNKAITYLMNSTENKMTICTPYFNFPTILTRIIRKLLCDGKQIEIIIGDKTANDFYLPPEEPFKVISALPYLYEINLCRFIFLLQHYVDNHQLTIRLWKDGENSYHLKGIWIDNKWQLITGNNLNSRAWGLDLENAILIHDPQKVLLKQKNKELRCITTNTHLVNHYQELENIQRYPVKVKKLISHLRRIRLDRLISRIV